MKKIRPIRQLKPLKPLDRMQNMQTIPPIGAKKWIKAHWRWDYKQNQWIWVEGHWSK